MVTRAVVGGRWRRREGTTMGVRSLRAAACALWWPSGCSWLRRAPPRPGGRARPHPADRPLELPATAVSQTSVSLAWGPSTDNVGVVSYSVWVDGGNGVQSVQPPQTTATFTGLRPGTTYAFHIAAFDARYNASATRSVTVTTVADTGAPSSPSGLAVQAIDSGKIRLQWTNGVDGIGPVTHEVLVNGVVTPNGGRRTRPARPRPPPRASGSATSSRGPRTPSRSGRSTGRATPPRRATRSRPRRCPTPTPGLPPRRC